LSPPPTDPHSIEIVALARVRKTTQLATVRSGFTVRKGQKTYIVTRFSLPSVTNRVP